MESKPRTQDAEYQPPQSENTDADREDTEVKKDRSQVIKDIGGRVVDVAGKTVASMRTTAIDQGIALAVNAQATLESLRQKYGSKMTEAQEADRDYYLDSHSGHGANPVRQSD